MLGWLVVDLGVKVYNVYCLYCYGVDGCGYVLLFVLFVGNLNVFEVDVLLLINVMLNGSDMFVIGGVLFVYLMLVFLN